MSADLPRARRGHILISILVLLFVVGVVPLLWTSYTLYSRNREILELDQKALQLNKARSLSQQVAVYVRSLHDQIRTIARTLAAEGGSFSARVTRIRDSKALESYVGENSFLTYLSVADSSGLGARSGFQLAEADIQQLLAEGFRRGLEGREMVSQPLLSESLKEPVLVIGEPVKPADGRAVEGVVLGVASLGPLWNMTKEMGEEGQIDVYVVDGRGRLVAHSDPSRLLEDRDLSSVEIVKMFLESRGSVGATVPFTLAGGKAPVAMLGTYARVADDSGWGVIVQIEQQKAYFSAIQMRTQSIVLVSAVTVLAAVLGTLFAGQITRPIGQLVRGALRLAGGEYTTRVSVRSRNEVGVLADTFNHMGEEIQKAIEEISRQASVNKELFMGSIRMLANTIDEKDPYTRGHSERVAYYSSVIAKHLGMPPEAIEKVHLSGIIHDVGKIGIEDKILRKASALTDDEYEIMKQHPSKGEHILEAVPMLKEMAGDGLMHHENMDGSGYPRGLKGDQIPLLGRIVSVADAFDAMTTDRPYSKAMTFEAALARLRQLIDKKFDGPCVEAMERASQAGDLSPAKARRASIEARKLAEQTAS
jgi:HD-GYP domain-containing protein (c-di-GMP phosphodiesterase class II)